MGKKTGNGVLLLPEILYYSPPKQVGKLTTKKGDKTPKPNQSDISPESGCETPKQRLHDHVTAVVAHGSWAGNAKNSVLYPPKMGRIVIFHATSLEPVRRRDDTQNSGST
jgi:hypothetical protein